jgi:hypothetical protein
MQTFTIDLASLKPHQRQAILALVKSFFEPHFVKTSDELYPSR